MKYKTLVLLLFVRTKFSLKFVTFFRSIPKRGKDGVEFDALGTRCSQSQIEAILADQFITR